MAKINRIGYGQVEPNHLSAQRTAQIYAQLPADQTLTTLENGQFVKYNYADNKVDLEGEGEWMLVYNEIKLYRDRQTTKDFALKSEEAVGGEIVPRVFKTNIGDIYTTNCLEKANVSGDALIEGTEDLSVGDVLAPSAAGFLTKAAGEDAETMKFQIVKIYTLPDGQSAVKVMRIA